MRCKVQIDKNMIVGVKQENAIALINVRGILFTLRLSRVDILRTASNGAMTMSSAIGTPSRSRTTIAYSMRIVLRPKIATHVQLDPNIAQEDTMVSS